MIVLEPIYILNFVLCILITGIAYWAYKESEDVVAYYIAGAYALFGFSHLMVLLNIYSPLFDFLVVVRVLAYLLIMAAIVKKYLERPEL